MPAEVQQPILDRAGGNPLYAEEFVRLLRDRDLLERVGSSWQLRRGCRGAVPRLGAGADRRTVGHAGTRREVAVGGRGGDRQGLLGRGGRGDGRPRPPDRHRHAAGAVAQGAGQTVTPVVDGGGGGVRVLACARPRRRLQPAPTRLPRHPACRCRQVDRVESTRPGRRPRRRPRLPLHRALDLAPRRATPTRQPNCKHPRSGSSTLAGERALGLDTAAALASFERALALTPEGHPERAAALARFGEAAFHAGRYGEAKDALEEAIDAFRAAGDRRGAARGDDHARHACSAGSGIRASWELPAEALALLEPLPPGPEHVAALTEAAARESLQGASRGRDRLRRAGAGAWPTSSGCPRPARALGFRGMARCELGDRGGLDDFREAIVLATQAGQGREVAILHNNYAHRALAGRRPRARPWRCCGRGSRSPRRAASPSMTDDLTANTLDVARRDGRARAGADARRRARRHASKPAATCSTSSCCGSCRRGS